MLTHAYPFCYREVHSSLDWYSDPVERKVAELMQTATSLRFDASDLMPGEVGAGSF